MTLLALDRLRNAEFKSDPFRWGHLTETFSSIECAERLRRDFPVEGFRVIAQPQGDKTYLLCGRALDPVDSPIWQALVEELKGAAYQAAIEASSGLDLTGLDLELTVWRQLPGGYLSPHTDKPDKVLTHLIYFGSSVWSEGAGGALRILRSANLEDPAATIQPRLGASAFIVRSDHSWHGYLPIEPHQTERCSLQIVWHRRGLAYSNGLRPR